MAFTYSWGDLVSLVGDMVKGVPLSKLNVKICDLISAEMWNEYPWKQAITNTAKGSIPLLDSVQDYTCAAPNIDRLLKAWLIRYDVTPNEVRDLDVKKDLSIDLYPRSYVSIRAVSLQQSLGLFRIESAVNIPSGVQIELQCDYQINPQKVTSLNDILWMDDRWWGVAVHGLMWWAYQFTDDSRAGSANTDAFGRIIGYTGQLGTYKAAVNKMKMGEEVGFTESVFPAEPMGLPRDSNSLNIFGW